MIAVKSEIVIIGGGIIGTYSANHDNILTACGFSGHGIMHAPAVGRAPPGPGGGIVAHNTSRADLENRINDAPFVAEKVVTAEINEITPAKTDDRLNFLLG